MTNNKRRRLLKEAEKEARKVETQQMRETQRRAREQRRESPRPARTRLSGAEKHRKRKGGNPNGGPGGGGIQGSMRRLKASLDKGDEALRGHRLGKGFA